MRKKGVDYALSNKNVQRFIHRNDSHFDLVINEELQQEAFLIFAHKYKAPIISICTYGVSNYFDNDFGLLTPVSHVPDSYLGFNDNMTFMQRFHNTIVSIGMWALHRFVYLSNQSELAEKHFSYLSPLPSLDDLRKNISLMLVNTHRSILPPRPSMPGVSISSNK